MTKIVAPPQPPQTYLRSRMDTHLNEGESAVCERHDPDHSAGALDGLLMVLNKSRSLLANCQLKELS